ncbi:hypothetical protein HPB50_023370 [Hyalomma asiaticum]|uniref:Uncharacterized protein n=1 Tax=Hyalomma asiaticum TaxID=266040 RepID=A0ACB7TQA8_HYAAI|nr:hypothetical protein HPB50_023370 [Hyalomma asiaticum]
MPKGKIEELMSGTDWSSWVERMDYEANDTVESSKKREVLFMMCGEQTYETLKAVVAPRKPSEKQGALANKSVKDNMTAPRTLAKDCIIGKVDIRKRGNPVPSKEYSCLWKFFSERDPCVEATLFIFNNCYWLKKC